MDCDGFRKQHSELWAQRDDKYSVMCVKHEYKPTKQKNFL